MPFSFGQALTILEAELQSSLQGRGHQSAGDMALPSRNAGPVARLPGAGGQEKQKTKKILGGCVNVMRSGSPTSFCRNGFLRGSCCDAQTDGMTTVGSL